MYGKMIIRCCLVVRTGLHIGAGNAFSAIGAVDSQVVRDPLTGLPMIPGSSLKGKLRSLLARSLSKDIQRMPDFDQDDGRIKRLFGSANPVHRARLQFADGNFQHGAFHFPSLAQLIIDLYPVWQLPGGHRLLGSRLNGRYAMALWDGTAPFPVDWVLGAALMVRGDVVAAIGGLDDGYFMYCEELDWCLRMRQAGHEILAAPAARIVHHEGQSSRQAPWRSLERLWHSRFRFFEKFSARYPPGYLFWVRRIVRPAMRRRIAGVRRQMAQGAITAPEGAEAIAAFQRIVAL